MHEIKQGFIDFNGKVGLEDLFDPTGAVRGDVTMFPEDLRSMRSLYRRLLNMTVPLSSALPSALKL